MIGKEEGSTVFGSLTTFSIARGVLFKSFFVNYVNYFWHRLTLFSFIFSSYEYLPFIVSIILKKLSSFVRKGLLSLFHVQFLYNTQFSLVTFLCQFKVRRRRRLNEQCKKETGSISKTTTLHWTTFFFANFFAAAPLHDNGVKLPDFTFSGKC